MQKNKKCLCRLLVQGAVPLFMSCIMLSAVLSPALVQAASAKVCAGAVGKNPYCYTLSPTHGKLIYHPGTNLCHYVICVSTFWKDSRGYVVECKDDHYSHSGGIRGACSRNKGVKQALYAH